MSVPTRGTRHGGQTPGGRKTKQVVSTMFQRHSESGFPRVTGDFRWGFDSGPRVGRTPGNEPTHRTASDQFTARKFCGGSRRCRCQRGKGAIESLGGKLAKKEAGRERCLADQRKAGSSGFPGPRKSRNGRHRSVPDIMGLKGGKKLLSMAPKDADGCIVPPTGQNGNPG
jgi:hypothetical protein